MDSLMTFYDYIIWFAVFSFAGWLFECVNNIVVKGQWENRGFLWGPLCPIYGVGVVSAMALFRWPPIADLDIPLWGIFLICMFGSAVLEYATSVLMERVFHARWWDYSNLPLNLNGRICLPASLLFGVSGVLICLLVIPWAQDLATAVPYRAREIAGLLILVITTVDVTLSVSALTQLVEKIEAASASFDQAMEAGLEAAKDAAKDVAEAIPGKDALSDFSVREKLDGVLPDIPDAAETLRDTVLGLASSLDARQKRVLSSLKSYSSKSGTMMVAYVRKGIDSLSSVLPGKPGSKPGNKPGNEPNVKDKE